VFSRVLNSSQFKDCYFELNSSGSTPTAGPSKVADDDSSGSEEEEASTPKPSVPVEEAWRREFNRYLNGEDELPEGMTLVQWWAVRTGHKFIIFMNFTHQGPD